MKKGILVVLTLACAVAFGSRDSIYECSYGKDEEFTESFTLSRDQTSGEVTFDNITIQCSFGFIFGHELICFMSDGSINLSQKINMYESMENRSFPKNLNLTGAMATIGDSQLSLFAIENEKVYGVVCEKEQWSASRE